MKKFIVVLGLLSVVAFLVAVCGRTSESNVALYDDIVYVSTSYAYMPRTLTDLEEKAQVIVRGRMLDGYELVPGGYFKESSYLPESITKLEITEVIKGDVRVGEQIILSEAYYIEDRTLYTSSNYLPSLINQEYFFFLYDRISEDSGLPDVWWDMYVVVAQENGRYRVPDSGDIALLWDYTRADLSLGDKYTMEGYMGRYKEVVDAYINGIRHEPQPMPSVISGGGAVAEPVPTYVDENGVARVTK